MSLQETINNLKNKINRIAVECINTLFYICSLIHTTYYLSSWTNYCKLN